MSHDDETTRIRDEYSRREREIPSDFYALSRPANLFIRHGQERALQVSLRRAGLLPLAGRRVLEVGCGSGQWLNTFVAFGAHEADIAGIDLDAARVEQCRRRFPAADLRVGNAVALPWADRGFDVVFQSTLFTSILSEDYRRQVAEEMIRVTAERGCIVWYDFAYDNPLNPSVRGIKRGEIERLFSGWSVESIRTTLAPPLARILVPVSWTLAGAIEKLRILNTHLLAIARRT